MKKFKRLIGAVLSILILVSSLNLTLFSTAFASDKIPFSYEILGEYYVNAQGYRWAKVTKDYKDLKQGATFFINSDDEVVVDTALLQKLVLVGSFGEGYSALLRERAQDIYKIRNPFR